MFDFDKYATIDELEQSIPCDVWQKIHGNTFYNIYKDKSRKYTAIIVTDEQKNIRATDVLKKQSDGITKSIYLYTGAYSDLRTYSDIVFIRSVENAIEEKYGKSPEWMLFNRKRAERIVYRNYHKKFSGDPYSVPLSNNVKAWRTVADPDGESCTDFIIIPDQWSELWGTDEEQTIYDDIEQFVYDTVGYNTAYDFPTGRMITLSWSFVRTPSGVAIVHRRGIDW